MARAVSRVLVGPHRRAGAAPRPCRRQSPNQENHRKKTQMNVLLWILQVAVAFLYVSGGVYKMFRFDQLAGFMQAIPRGGWRALGLLEVVGGLLLVIPMTIGWMPALTPLAAV